jgi:WbqC-like protein
MIIGIMQPYFFPYIGYFQLISHSDVFVFHDDVQYIKGGWINRNRIINGGKVCWLTLPVLRAAHDRLINDRYYSSDADTRNRLLRRIAAAYRKAPRFHEIYPIIEEIIDFADLNVATFNIHLIRRLADYLKIPTAFMLSSKLLKNNNLAGQERVIEICRVLGATKYVNLIGGKQLYQRDDFSRAGLTLSFLNPTVLCNPVPTDPAVPLSILDDLMHKEQKKLVESLEEYKITT